MPRDCVDEMYGASSLQPPLKESSPIDGHKLSQSRRRSSELCALRRLYRNLMIDCCNDGSSIHSNDIYELGGIRA